MWGYVVAKTVHVKEANNGQTKAPARTSHGRLILTDGAKYSLAKSKIKFVLHCFLQLNFLSTH